MKKLLCLALAVLMLFALAACAENPIPTESKNDTTPATTQAPDTQAPDTTAAPAPAEAPTPAEIEAAIAAALGDGYLATVDVAEEEIYLCPLGWLEDMSVLDSWVAKQAVVSAVDLDNVVVAKCKDPADTEKVVNAFNNSFAQTVSYIRQYPFGTAKVLGARIYRVGDTVMFLLAGASDDSGDAETEAKLAETEYAKIDAAVEALFGFVPENLAVIPEDGGNSGGGLLGG